MPACLPEQMCNPSPSICWFHVNLVGMFYPIKHTVKIYWERRLACLLIRGQSRCTRDAYHRAGISPWPTIGKKREREGIGGEKEREEEKGGGGGGGGWCCVTIVYLMADPARGSGVSNYMGCMDHHLAVSATIKLSKGSYQTLVTQKIDYHSCELAEWLHG